MEEVIKIIIGIVVLCFGIPIGNLLAKNTPEELKDGRKWFIALIILSLVGALLNLIFMNDAFLFTFLFIAIVASRSIVKKEKKKINKKNKSKRK
jgi:uncharacterized membrane protein HdeD (DUF308 family)